MPNFPARRVPKWERQRTSLTGPARQKQQEADDNAAFADVMVDLLGLVEPTAAVTYPEDADVEF